MQNALCVLAALPLALGAALQEESETRAPSRNDRFGWEVHGAGDTNGDGHDDLLVGDWIDRNGSVRDGSVWLVSGRDGSVLHHFRGQPGVVVPQSEVFVGRFDSIGDVDGDGRPDVYLRLYDRGDETVAYARIHSGLDGVVLADFAAETRITPSSYSYLRPWSVLDDLDGDGFPEIAVGDPAFDDEREGTGRVLVESGRDGSILFAIRHPDGRWRFGLRVEHDEDLDGDGRDDIRIKSNAAADGDGRSAASMSYSGAGGEPLALAPTRGTPIGDLDGDGKTEFLETRSRNSHVRTRSGVDLFAVLPDTRFGTACALGDVDGDGRPDFVVSDQEGYAGCFWFVSGSGGAVLHRYVGDFMLDNHLGSSLDVAGDVDADGIPDLIAGGVYGLCCDLGRARVLSGKDGHSLLFLNKHILNMRMAEGGR